MRQTLSEHSAFRSASNRERVRTAEFFRAGFTLLKYKNLIKQTPCVKFMIRLKMVLARAESKRKS